MSGEKLGQATETRYNEETGEWEYSPEDWKLLQEYKAEKEGNKYESEPDYTDQSAEIMDDVKAWTEVNDRLKELDLSLANSTSEALEAEDRPEPNTNPKVEELKQKAEEREKLVLTEKDKHAILDKSRLTMEEAVKLVSAEQAADIEEQLAKDEAEETAKEVAEEAEKQEITMTAEEIEEAKQELADIDKRLKELEEGESESIEAMLKEHADIEARLAEIGTAPLTAINANWTHDKREIAHDLAEQALNAETAKGNIIKKLWKGTLFKKYYEQKYTREFMDGAHTDEQGRTVNDIIKGQTADVMARFVLGATEDMRYIHEKIGKKNKDGSYDGEKLIPADEQTNAEVRELIEDYARRRPRYGEKLSELDSEFQDEMNRILRRAIDDGRLEKGAMTNNYLEVAKEAARRYELIAENAKTKAEHDLAMEQVMEGFRVYNAEVRNNVRTEAHRDAIDKIVNRLESSAIGRFIPAEVLAGAAGLAAGLAQTGARAAFGAAGGILASSALAGLRERNRVTEDRARMMRDMASGMEYGDESSSAKTKRYEQRIGGTVYEMRKASDLTEALKKAMESDSETKFEDLVQAIAEARVRIDFSDAEQKDLVAFSSPDKRGKERLELDMAVIRAEKMLAEEDKEYLGQIKKQIKKEILNGYTDEEGNRHAGVAEQDESFKKLRTYAAMKQAGKSLALGAIAFFGTQEITATLDPSKIGVLEKAGIIKAENATDAKETLLASGFGKIRSSLGLENGLNSTTTTDTIKVTSNDPAEIQRLESEGYVRTNTQVGGPMVDGTTVNEIDPTNSTLRANVKYDGWANNGTKISDGNELRAHIENGKFISTMRGNSTMNGQVINYDTSNVKAFVTVGNSKFEVVGKLNESGQLTWGENGVFEIAGGNGSTIQAIGPNGEKLYKYFEIVADNGVDANGVQHIVPFATDVGKNTFAGKIQQVTENIIQQPDTYTYVKEITTVSEIANAGTTLAADGAIGYAMGYAAGANARTGLGRASAPEAPDTTPENAGPAEEAPEEVPEEPGTPEENPAEENPTEETPEEPEAPEEESQEAADGEGSDNQAEPTESAEPTGEPTEPAEPTGEPTEPTEPAEPTGEPTEPAAPNGEPEASETTSDSDNEQNTGENAEGEFGFDQIMEELNNNKALIGDKGVSYISSDVPINERSDQDQAELAEWWNNLSEDGKTFIRRIVDKMKSAIYKIEGKQGKGFLNWFGLNNF